LSELIWHDLESGGYTVDFEFWLGLCPATVLELGAGAGRVSLALAMGGATVTAVDLDAALVRELRHRAGALGLEVEAIVADARELDLGKRFEQVIAPLAFVQLLTGRRDRVAMMRGAGRHLEPGGRLWLAIHPALDDALFDPGEPPRPEWIGPYETQVVGARRVGDRLLVRRRRRDRAAGRTTYAEIAYAEVADLEAEAREAGLEPAGRTTLPEDDWYIPAQVVSFRAPDGR
jgi:SAM-dependent methyltransferase